MDIKFHKIGIIETPYTDNAPYQPVSNDKGVFKIILEQEYKDGLVELEKFKYIYVIYYIDKIKKPAESKVIPPWLKQINKSVGIFASRSPNRPNRIGISIVEIKEIKDNIIFTSGLDVFSDTPLLDIKPYIKDLDSKCDANKGWLDNLDENDKHLMLHINGIPHDHDGI